MNRSVCELTNYELEELIHSSDRTLVYRGRKINDGQPVVIKLMQREYPTFNELIQFRNQYVIAKNLDVEGIVKPYGLERYENRYALIMEDFGGISADEYYQNDSASIPEFLSLAIQLSQILHQLHQNRVIHKDIKPANILINPETKEVRLIDLSISSLLPKETQTLQTPNVLEGTLAYISPEQTGRMNRGIDYRSDFYSLGVTFYQLLNGNLPFETNDALELIHCHIAKIPAALDKKQKEDIPAVLSDIVLKLMAKNAEDRYQSALGLKHDLEKCFAQWQEKGSIETFELGERDLSDRFLIPEKLYGREKEVQTLLDAFERVSQGSGELLLVAGYSGVGKTAVVNEAHKPITEKRGYFIKGKFDQFQRNIPFFAFVIAFRDLMKQLLAESDAQLENWKNQILKAVGENGQVIIEVIPELEAIIGKQPPVPQLEGSAAQNRFNLLFPKFVGVFLSDKHPLTIFIDDLQWADSASLSLLKLLMNKSERGYLLILGAYRDNEVFPAHPLMLALDEIKERGANFNTLTLKPLSGLDINQLVADTLLCQLEVARPLSQIVYQKTQGNSFFTIQFLRGLHEEGCIIFDLDGRYWKCDLTRVRQLALTDDVVAFMVGKLQKLPERTQDVLKLAACIGNRFDLATLAIVYEKSQEEVTADLWSALQEGLVLPESETYKLFQGDDFEVEAAGNIAVNYYFLHDRVQQAAYSLIAEREKQSTHFKIGQLLLKSVSDPETTEKIFEIVNQLNRGIELGALPSSREELARLNVIAVRKAIVATAYIAAEQYIQIALSLLEPDCWNRQYELTLSIYLLGVKTTYLNARFEKMNELAEAVFKNVRHLVDEIPVRELTVRNLIAQNKFIEAIESGLSFLKLLGVNLPKEPIDSDLELALSSVGERVKVCGINNLSELPRMERATKSGAMTILTSLMGASYKAIPKLFLLIILKMVELSIEYGNDPNSPCGYAGYATILSGILEDFERGYKVGEIALKVISELDAKEVKPKTIFMASSYVCHWKQHLTEILPSLQLSYTSALEVGDFEFAGYGATFYCWYSYFSGKNLAYLLQEMKNYRQVIIQLQQEPSLNFHQVFHQATLNLVEGDGKSYYLRGEICQEDQMLDIALNGNDKNLELAAYVYCNKLILSYLLGANVSETFGNAVETEKYISSVPGSLLVRVLNFYSSLAYLSAYENLEDLDKPSLLQKVESNQKKMQLWLTHAPMNCQHQFDLIEAEKSRVLGQKAEAIEGYDRAIAGAKKNKYIQEEALANELAAKFYLQWGKKTIAEVYMQKAYYCYAQWEAKAKTQYLEECYPELLKPILQSDRPSRSSGLTISNAIGITHTSTMSSISTILDFSSLLKASQTLSGEIELESLLSTLMDVIVQSAGATKGALMLVGKGGLTVEAMATITGENTLEIGTLGQSIPLKQSQELPVRLINYVRRTAKMAILDANTARAQFGDDAYIIRNSPQSLLCVPLLGRRESMPENSNRLMGILYLENTVTADAFTSDRVELLNALCAQAAISLENARLYRQAQQALTNLQNAQLQLVQNEKMATLGNLVAGVAHEINNPLTFISGNVEISQDYLEDIFSILERYRQEYTNPSAEFTEEIEERDLDFILEDFPQVIASMETGVERIRNISTSLRTFSRTDTDAKSELNLRDGLESTLLILKYRLQANDERPAIEVVTNYGNVPPIQCYPGQLNQVFMNLLANAIDAMEEGNAGRSLDDIKANPNRILIQTYREGERAIIKINDNGTGMPEEVQAKIFESGFTTKAVGKGTGLGMAISHQIVVEKHDGTIACTSELGVGTEFTISLPLTNYIKSH